jgi:hypothetical protein
MGKILFRPWERIWKTWTPAKCRFFLWLVAHKRCWTLRSSCTTRTTSS